MTNEYRFDDDNEEKKNNFCQSKRELTDVTLYCSRFLDGVVSRMKTENEEVSRLKREQVLLRVRLYVQRGKNYLFIYLGAVCVLSTGIVLNLCTLFILQFESFRLCGELKKTSTMVPVLRRLPAVNGKLLLKRLGHRSYSIFNSLM